MLGVLTYLFYLLSKPNTPVKHICDCICTCSQTPPIQALPLPKSLESGQPQVPG